MNERGHGRHHPEGLDGNNASHGFHRPYWKHAHRDWRLWVSVSLMFVALGIYVMSDDLAWQPRGQSQQPLSSAVAK